MLLKKHVIWLAPFPREGTLRSSTVAVTMTLRHSKCSTWNICLYRTTPRLPRLGGNRLLVTVLKFGKWSSDSDW